MPASNSQFADNIEIIYNKYKLFLVEETVDYKFKNKANLIKAFNHSSSCIEFLSNYQRLEFLGDSILAFLIKSFLFEHRKNYSPGHMTVLHNVLVSNAMFANLAVKYNFHKHLLADFDKPQNRKIKKYVNFYKQQTNCDSSDSDCFNFVESSDEETEEEEIDEDECIKVPKVLADIFEALAGAIYVDCGKNLEKVWRIFRKLMREEIKKYCEMSVKNLPQKIKIIHPKPKSKNRKSKTGKAVTVTLDSNHKVKSAKSMTLMQNNSGNERAGRVRNEQQEKISIDNQQRHNNNVPEANLKMQDEKEKAQFAVMNGNGVAKIQWQVNVSKVSNDNGQHYQQQIERLMVENKQYKQALNILNKQLDEMSLIIAKDMEEREKDQ